MSCGSELSNLEIPQPNGDRSATPSLDINESDVQSIGEAQDHDTDHESTPVIRESVKGVLCTQSTRANFSVRIIAIVLTLKLA